MRKLAYILYQFQRSNKWLYYFITNHFPLLDSWIYAHHAWEADCLYYPGKIMPWRDFWKRAKQKERDRRPDEVLNLVRERNEVYGTQE